MDTRALLDFDCSQVQKWTTTMSQENHTAQNKSRMTKGADGLGSTKSASDVIKEAGVVTVAIMVSMLVHWIYSGEARLDVSLTVLGTAYAVFAWRLVRVRRK